MARGLIFTLDLNRKKKTRFYSLHRSSCVGKVIRRIVEQTNIQCSAFTPKEERKSDFNGSPVAYPEIRTKWKILQTETHCNIYPKCSSARGQPLLLFYFLECFMFIRATWALPSSKLDDLCTYVGILVASSLSSSLFYNLMRASI